MKQKNRGFSQLPGKWQDNTDNRSSVTYRRMAMQPNAPGHITCPGVKHSTTAHDEILGRNAMECHCSYLLYQNDRVPVHGMHYTSINLVCQ